MERSRRPVAANIALANAGGAGGAPHSPPLPGVSVGGRITVSIAGMWLILTSSYSLKFFCRVAPLSIRISPYMALVRPQVMALSIWCSIIMGFM